LAEKNKETLDTIEKAMFVAVLDDKTPKVRQSTGQGRRGGEEMRGWTQLQE